MTSRSARSSASRPRTPRTARSTAGRTCRAGCSTMTDADKESELRELVRHYGRDVVGNFDPRVYKFATGIGPSIARLRCSRRSTALRHGFGVLQGARSRGSSPDGEIELAHRVRRARHPDRHAHALLEHGLAGDRLRPAPRAACRPTTYGAGKNLFTNPFISYFMRNLGAYRVDRRLRFELYKDVLEGVLDRAARARLPLAVLPRRDAVPVEHHREAPQARPARHHGHRVQEHRPRGHAAQAALHRAGDDQLPARARGRDPDRRLPRRDRQEPLHHHRRRVLSRRPHHRVLSQDPRRTRARWSSGSAARSIAFGNDITDEGESIDRAGRSVDPASFVRGADGEVTDDDQRDAEYTRALGRRLVRGLSAR